MGYIGCGLKSAHSTHKQSAVASYMLLVHCMKHLGIVNNVSLISRMASVNWFGNYDLFLAYIAFKDGFDNSQFFSKLSASSPSIVVVYMYSSQAQLFWWIHE
jgi:hypothetical protein